MIKSRTVIGLMSLIVGVVLAVMTIR